jgi:ribose 5-phosphate isomerase B
MKVYLATDHAGFALKEAIKTFLLEKKFIVEDCGALSFDKDDDYPDFIAKAAAQVSKDPENSRGIIFGSSGQAEMMVANKFRNVRCALFYSTVIPQGTVDVTGRKSDDPYEMIRLTREHNNANMLSLAARLLTEEEAKKAIELFLNAPFPGDERHVRRINKIKEIENKNYV